MKLKSKLFLVLISATALSTLIAFGLRMISSGEAVHDSSVAISPQRTIANSAVGNSVAADDTSEKVQSNENIQIVAEYPGRYVRCVASSPDGKIIAAGVAALDDDNPGYVDLLDSSSGKSLRKLPATFGDVVQVAFSPDGKSLVSSVSTWHLSPTLPDQASPHRVFGEVKLWDIDTGQSLKELPPPNDNVYTLSFSPDGKTVAIGGAGIRLWDLTSGRVRWEAFKGQHTYLDFSPDGKAIISVSGDDKVRLWNAQTGKLLRVFNRLTSKDWGIILVAFSPDNKTFATVDDDNIDALIAESETETHLRVWSARTGQLLHQRTVELNGYTLRELAFSPNGRLLATAGHMINEEVWDLNSGKVRQAPHETLSVLGSVDFSPDGKNLIVGNWDGVEGRVLLWRIK
jgi:WD40 repeat protein